LSEKSLKAGDSPPLACRPAGEPELFGWALNREYTKTRKEEEWRLEEPFKGIFQPLFVALTT
jgi:hypothetical protein